MKYLKKYKIFESSDSETGVILEDIDLILEDIIDKGYDVKQYYGFENKSLYNDYQKIYHLDRRYIDNLLMPGRRTPSNEDIYQDYLKGNMSYIIKIYSYMESKGYTNDFPFGEITYSDVCDTLSQLIGYMSEEKGLSHYTIKGYTNPKKKNGIWDFTSTSVNNIEDLKNVKVVGCLIIQLSKNKELLVDTI